MVNTTQLPPAAEFSGNVLFYSKPEPLSRELHGKIGLKRMDRPFGFAANTNVVPLTVGEFPVAGISYPIIFAGERYQPLAVMSIRQGTNLYVSQDGAFEVGSYIPAYVRRYPFVLANDQQREQLVVCIDRNAQMLGENPDLPFFNAQGEPTDYTNGCIQFCNDFENEGRRTESFISLLRELDLFEVAQASFTPNNPDGTPGTAQPIAEYFAVSEAKLKALPQDKLLELVANGAVAQIYAHLMSLTGWDRLIAMTMARQPVVPAANMN
ncbi:MAG TPA: SapC family protein [Caulobacteraceae bacterium]|jgi:hypothetical protein|nr:SapC family protein [Caulobacteraceae bacterium]